MLAMAIGLERLRMRTGSIVHNIGALVVTAIAGFFIVFGLFMLEMPLFWRDDVGGLFWNRCCSATRMPAVLLLALSYTRRGQARPRLRQHARRRRAGAGADLCDAAGPPRSSTVRCCLAAARATPNSMPIRWRGSPSAWCCWSSASSFASQRARLASAVVIGLTVLKAFLVDMSNLTGVYRALSFMGLGLVLVMIGWLYQRILFKRQAPPPEAAAAG